MKDALKDFKIKEQEFKGKGQYKRGQIYMLDYLKDVVGDEQFGNRPVVIISNDVGNYHSFVKEVVPLTTRIKPKLPTHVLINSTKEESTALCEQILRVDDKRLGYCIGQCTPEEMIELDYALAVSVGIEMPKKMIDAGNDPILVKALEHINEIMKVAAEIQSMNERMEQLKHESISKFGELINESIIDDINGYIEQKVRDNLQNKYDIIQYLINGKRSVITEEQKEDNQEIEEPKKKPIKFRLDPSKIDEIKRIYLEEHKTIKEVADITGITRPTVSRVVKELGISRPRGSRSK